MAKLTLTIELDNSALDFLMGRPIGSLTLNELLQLTDREDEPDLKPDVKRSMTPQEVQDLLIALAPNSPARRLLTEIASKPNGYAISALEREFGLDRKAIGGQLSAVTFARDRAKLPKTLLPYRRIVRDGEPFYEMTPEVARTIRLWGRKEAIEAVMATDEQGEDYHDLQVELDDIHAEITRLFYPDNDE
jgi:hypothetical protein